MSHLKRDNNPIPLLLDTPINMDYNKTAKYLKRKRWYYSLLSISDMNKEEILQYFGIMNDKLKERNIEAYVNVYGGAVMCMVFNSRDNTKDIDAIFEPETVLKEIAADIAREYKLSNDWFNDEIKLFKPETRNNTLYKRWSNLKLYVPSAEYMLALKCYSARFGKSKDLEDIIYLIQHLNIKTFSQAIDIIEKFFDLNALRGEVREFLLEKLGD